MDQPKKEHSDSVKPVEKSEKNLTEKIRENPWVLSTVVLGVVLIVLLFASFANGGITGGAIGTASKTDVETKVIDFVKSQVDGNVSISKTETESGLYKVTISLDGKEIPIYVTLDGENLVQGVTPISLIMEQAQNGTQQTTATEVPKLARPKVELFVMSMCPYGTQAEKGLIPVVELLKSKIDFQLKFVSYAMHGKNEIDENTIQYCVKTQQPDKLVSYLRCYLGDSTPEKWAECQDTVKLDKTKLNNCVKATDTQYKITELFNDKATWSGGSYPQYNVNKADNTKYGVQGSPTLVINGVNSNAGRSPDSYLKAICAAFTTAPSECSQSLSTVAPNPGFGWETSGTATTNTAAQCG